MTRGKTGAMLWFVCTGLVITCLLALPSCTFEEIERGVGADEHDRVVVVEDEDGDREYRRVYERDQRVYVEDDDHFFED